MTFEATKKRRARHVASDEAHAWARSLPLNNPNAKTVLRALALYVNGDGSCFVGIDQLSEDTDLSPDTVRRRLVWLEQIGAIVRLAQWLDENGRRNSEGRGKRTSDEIRLLLAADIDEIEARATGQEMSENAQNSSTETMPISPSREQGLDQGEESVSPRLAPRQPLQSCEGLISEPEPESPPKPPSWGSAGSPEGWKDFEIDWSEPILRQSIAQQVWAALNPEERNLARQAARGYVAHRKAQKKPPNVIGAHIFLKERDAWPEFAKRDPNPLNRTFTGGIPSASPEAKAVIALYAVARAVPFEHKGRITYPAEITPQIMAFSQMPDRSQWIWIEDYRQVKSWTELIGAKVFGARGTLVVLRDFDGVTRTGIWAPWPWPPSVDGKIYPTGPPETLISDQELADFK